MKQRKGRSHVTDEAFKYHKGASVRPSEKSMLANGRPKCVRWTRLTGTLHTTQTGRKKNAVVFWEGALNVRLVRHYLLHYFLFSF